MLAARPARGGRIVTLAKPHLPRRLFDLCIVPEHEGGRSSKRVFAPRGALPQPGSPRPRAQGTGLVVVGGPSSAHRWSAAELDAQNTDILVCFVFFCWFFFFLP